MRLRGRSSNQGASPGQGPGYARDHGCLGVCYEGAEGLCPPLNAESVPSSSPWSVAFSTACVHSKENIREAPGAGRDGQPEGAYVSRVDNTGTQSLGPGPVDAEVQLRHNGARGLAGGMARADHHRDPDHGRWHRSARVRRTEILARLFGGIMLTGFAGYGLFGVSAASPSPSPPRMGTWCGRAIPGDKPPEFRASLPGHSEASASSCPETSRRPTDVIRLALHPMGGVAHPGQPAPPSNISGPGSPFAAPGGEDRPIVAVFEIQDVGRKLSSDLTASPH